MNQTAKNIIGGALFVALVAAGVVLFLKRTPSQVEIGPGSGTEAPDFSLRRVDSDEEVSLSSFRGKTVLLDFWATWCPPCREQMPIVQKLADDPSLSDDLVILSVNADEARPDRQAKVETYLSDNGYRFTTIMDDGRAVSAYGVSNLPTLFIVDPQGKVAHRDVGVHSEEKLRKVLGRVMR